MRAAHTDRESLEDGGPEDNGDEGTEQTGRGATFDRHIGDRTLTVGVIGLGYVGLPLMVGFSEVGFRTIGFDVDAHRVTELNLGTSHIEDISDVRVTAAVDSGRFEATDDPAMLGTCDAIFIAVPTPFDEAKSPDLRHVESATDTIGSILRPDMLVILQSTTYPGTTDEVVRPRLEAASGLTAGADFHLAFSPERVDPGNTTYTLRNTPKLVGGVSDESARRAAALLESAMDEPGLVTVLSSPASAEMAKLLENTYRAVNVALINELAQIARAMGVDIWEVIAGASTKPFGFAPFHPGIGPGGHCIPVDPYYLSWRARQFDCQTKFIDMASDTNLAMADYVIDRIAARLNDDSRSLRGSRMLVLGASFKPGVSDIRNSRAVHVIEKLVAAGVDLSYHDPFVPTLAVGEADLKSTELTADVVEQADLVVVLVHHRNVDYHLIRTRATSVFDAINALGETDPVNPRIERL